MFDYELMNNGIRQQQSWWRISALVLLYLLTMTVVFFTWKTVYDDSLQFPAIENQVPERWYQRAYYYANHAAVELSHDIRLVKNVKNTDVGAYKNENNMPKRIVNERFHLICYYETPLKNSSFNGLRLGDVDGDLCTHINIGVVEIYNNTLSISKEVLQVLQVEVPKLRAKNSTLKLLLWIGGGASSDGFSTMVQNHNNRKLFIQSVKYILRKYSLDGIDLDWEFPSAYNKERQHLSQLLYEIRAEYRREKRDYLLSIAVAAPEGISTFAYDVGEINKYADYANLMTYDFHFYSRGTPFTGLNAPLYARSNERSILATLNINYSVNWWLANGLDRKKLMVGLPTYGHSFTLVNPFNNGIGAPASDLGRCGDRGFTTYSELCWFRSHNVVSSSYYDQKTCSPYLSSGSEWISFEDEQSIQCKAYYAVAAQLGGVMMFSLNTDDYLTICSLYKNGNKGKDNGNATFPLTNTIKRTLSL